MTGTRESHAKTCVLLLWDAAGLIGVSTRERTEKLDWKMRILQLLLVHDFRGEILIDDGFI
jgi:hypothetical protein